jgi:hypothetical protein
VCRVGVAQQETNSKKNLIRLLFSIILYILLRNEKGRKTEGGWGGIRSYRWNRRWREEKVTETSSIENGEENGL